VQNANVFYSFTVLTAVFVNVNITSSSRISISCYNIVSIVS